MQFLQRVDQKLAFCSSFSRIFRLYEFGDHRPLFNDHPEFEKVALAFGEALDLLRAGASGLWLFGSGT